MNLPNAFTVDVEDYYHVSAFEGYVDRRWDSFPSRIVANTRRILEILGAADVRATFFVLGWVAERFGSLVREIRECGHEIGSHGYGHELIYRLAPEAFRADLIRARNVLEDAIGEPVRAYRAPSFSITRRSTWALEILAQQGIRYDSSVFPIRHDRYGIPGARADIHRIDTPSGMLWEFPPSVVRIAGINVPISGGGYFRLYPLALSLRWLRQVNRKHGQPFVFFVHPWELDPSQPRLPVPSLVSRFRQYVNLRTTRTKLETLLKTFRFVPMSEVIERVGQNSVATVRWDELAGPARA